MINVVDRVPTFPNRIKVTKSDGTSEFVTWERADEPTVAGTPINKALFDSIVEDIGLNANKTVYVSTAGSDTLGDGTAANPYATIQKAINSLPKNLNGNDATINIAAGTYVESVSISRFFGGNIILSGVSGATVAVMNLSISNKCSVEVRNIKLDVSSGYISVTNNALFRSYVDTSANGSLYGVYVADGACAIFHESLAIYNTTGNAVNANSGGFVYISVLSGSGNKIGIAAAGGSQVAYGTSTIGAESNHYVTSGGRILSGSQLSIPSY